MKSILKLICSLILFLSLQSQAQWNILPTGCTDFLYAGYFLNNDTGFVFGDHTRLLKTIDGGSNWDSIVLPLQTQHTSMCFLGNDTGYLAGEADFMFKTFDGGLSWSIVNLPKFFLTYAIDFTDALHGVAVGENAIIMRTHDGGTTWIELSKIPLLGDTTYDLRTVQFVNDTLGYSAGGPLNGQSGIVIKTIDGGNNWFKIFEAYPVPVFTQIKFINDTIGWATGSCYINNPGCFRSRVLKTNNGGFSWQEVNIDSNGSFISSGELRSLDIKGNNIYCVGSYPPTMLASFDKGLTWQYQNPLNLNYPYHVVFTDSVTGYVVGDSGKVLKTTNGGVGFFELSPSTSIMNIYPNPARDYCIINANKFINATLSVYDITGRIITQQPFNTKADLDISTLTTGIYFAEVKDKDGRSIKGKLVRQ